MAKDGFSVDAAIAKGRELPEWYLDEPLVLPGDEFYLRAFWDLSTCRSIGMGVGPIPWTAIIQYGERSELDDELMEVFVVVMRVMDGEYLDEQNKEVKSSMPNKPSMPSRTPKRSIRKK